MTLNVINKTKLCTKTSDFKIWKRNKKTKDKKKMSRKKKKVQTLITLFSR